MINKNWKELIKPKKIDFVKDKESQPHAELVAEPLESGYGQTLGNMLRRGLLSSIRGAAVTSIKVEGITHEFTSIPGVIEDVTEIILNVKQLALKMNDVESTKIFIAGFTKIKGSFFSGETSMTATLFGTPIWVAASPMPFASYMVSNMSSVSSFNSLSKTVTVSATTLSFGSGNFKMLLINFIEVQIILIISRIVF